MEIMLAYNPETGCFYSVNTLRGFDGTDVESGEQGFGEPRFDGVWADEEIEKSDNREEK